MKRAASTSLEASSSHKRLTLVTEDPLQSFFAVLQPYEALRFLEATRALLDALGPAVLCRVLNQFRLATLHRYGCHCAVGADGVPQRRYYRATEPGVFLRMREDYTQHCLTEVHEEAAHLIASGVPSHRLIVLCANENPRNRLGTFVRYTTDRVFFDQLLYKAEEWIDVPAIFYFVCLDAARRDLVHQHLDWDAVRLKQRYTELGLLKRTELDDATEFALMVLEVFTRLNYLLHRHPAMK